MKPICLPYEPTDNSSNLSDNNNGDDYELIVAGWGATNPSGIKEIFL